VTTDSLALDLTESAEGLPTGDPFAELAAFLLDCYRDRQRREHDSPGNSES
jgi:hypothetical protein